MGKKEDELEKQQKIFDAAVAQYGEVIRKLTNEKNLLKAENISLQESLRKAQRVLVEVDMGNPIPLGSEERKMYVAAVAGFFKDILQPRILYMISRLHNTLEEADQSQDERLKGSLDTWRALLHWGNEAINEHVSNLNESNENQNGETI